jgi:hypothetical protein
MERIFVTLAIVFAFVCEVLDMSARFWYDRFR